jgi:UDP-glucose 4-epimerase
VKDVAHFCSMAATMECSGIFNLGSGVGVSTLELVDRLAETLQIAPIIQNEPARKFDVPAIILDSTRAKKEFNWNPRANLRTGLVEVCTWLRQVNQFRDATQPAICFPSMAPVAEVSESPLTSAIAN